jgi:hypothetical protein
VAVRFAAETLEFLLQFHIRELHETGPFFRHAKIPNLFAIPLIRNYTSHVMAAPSNNKLIRLVTLCPVDLIDELDRAVNDFKRDDPLSTRSTAVRRLLQQALRARKHPESGVRATV